MSDIEAAARAVIEAWDRPPLGAYAQTMHEAVSHLRSALAHAARGEERIDEAHRALGKPGRIDDDGCCVGCGRSVQPSPCCPDYPVWPGPCRMCYSDITPPPATGEAGTRGEDAIRADERERCAKWHDERAETSGNERAAWWHKDCAAALRALPEAREGGGKMANRIFAVYGERRVELRLCHRIGPDYSGPVWAVIVDGEGGPERFVELEQAKAHAEARVGAPLKWDATSR